MRCGRPSRPHFFHPVRIANLSACADLDHFNQDVRESLTDWMSWLKSELGFMGWRFDFTKVGPREAVCRNLRRTICHHLVVAGPICVDMCDIY